jgi:hypothetical protein
VGAYRRLASGKSAESVGHASDADRVNKSDDSSAFLSVGQFLVTDTVARERVEEERVNEAVLDPALYLLLIPVLRFRSGCVAFLWRKGRDFGSPLFSVSLT